VNRSVEDLQSRRHSNSLAGNTTRPPHLLLLCTHYKLRGFWADRGCNGGSCRAGPASLRFPQNARSTVAVAENFRPLQAVVRVAGVSGAHYKRVLSSEVAAVQGCAGTGREPTVRRHGQRMPV